MTQPPGPPPPPRLTPSTGGSTSKEDETVALHLLPYHQRRASSGVCTARSSNTSDSPYRGGQISADRSQVGSSSTSNSPILEECDYDKDRTVLYKLIESKDWKKVLELMEEDDEEDEKSLNRQAAIWVVRKERDGRLRWRLLPLHAALIFQAPLEVVEALLEAFPAAATLKDDQGMLPLHLACRNLPPNFKVLEELLTAHPAAVYVKDRKGRTPIQGGLAASGADKNPGLSVLELYTQIAAAGEKQRWKTEQEQQTTQKLQLLNEEHQNRLKAQRQDYEKQISELKESHAVTSGAMSAQLKASRIQQDQLNRELDKLRMESSSDRLEQASSDIKNLQHDNRQLRSLVQTLLDQHTSLRESLQTLLKDQQSWHDKRNAILREYCSVNEQAAATSQAHATIWDEELTATANKVKDKLKNLHDPCVVPSKTGKKKVSLDSKSAGNEHHSGGTEQREDSQGDSESDNSISRKRSKARRHLTKLKTDTVKEIRPRKVKDTEVETSIDLMFEDATTPKTRPGSRVQMFEQEEEKKDESHPTTSHTISYTHPAAVIVSHHGAEVLP